MNDLFWTCLNAHWLNFVFKTDYFHYSMQVCWEAWVGVCVCVCVRACAWGLSVRRGVARGAGRRKPCGVCAAAVGSYRRQSPGPGACCTPRPPPRSPRPPRSAPRGWPAWSSAPRRSSSSTWCVGSETTPKHNSWWRVNVCGCARSRWINLHCWTRCILSEELMINGNWKSSMFSENSRQMSVCDVSCWCLLSWP